MRHGPEPQAEEWAPARRGPLEAGRGGRGREKCGLGSRISGTLSEVAVWLSGAYYYVTMTEGPSSVVKRTQFKFKFGMLDLTTFRLD